jgi:hypothetical protein
MLKRLFSNFWISGKFETLLENAPFYIAGSQNPFMIISGPSESGKTNLSHNIMEQLVETGLFDQDFQISTSLNPGDEEEGSVVEEEKSLTQVFLESLHAQTAELLSKIESKLDVKTKQNILDVFVTYAKKVTKNCEENPMENPGPVLDELNKIVENYQRLPKFQDFSERQYRNVLSQMSLNDCFSVMVVSLFSTNIEESIGSIASEFLVKTLLQITLFCIENGSPRPFLRIDDTHYLYKEESGKDYLKNFVHSLISHKGVSCLFIGNCQFEEIIRLLHQNKDQIAWFHLENFNEDSSHDLYELFNLKVDDSKKKLLWETVGGNIAAADVVSERLAQGEPLEQIYQDFLKTGSKSIDLFFKVLEEQQDTLSIKEKVFGPDYNTARAFVHFLSQFLENPQQEQKIPISEYSANPVIEGLVVYGVITYNPVTEILKLDKPIISELLKNSEKYQKYSLWLSKSKNREAYSSLLSQYTNLVLNR